MWHSTRMNAFEFVESPAFSRLREDFLDDEGLRALQQAMISDPMAGDQIPGGGGIRKLRWQDSRRGKGKRGGLRIVYYVFLSDEEIWLLAVYGKGDVADLTKAQKDQMRLLLESERAVRKLRNL
jgi:hypothetical protein